MNSIIGEISKEVIDKLKLEENIKKHIYISESNIKHIKDNHLEDYNKYGNKISDIISNPTYIARHPKKDSIEYIKKYLIDNEYVLVAVRVTNKGVSFVRTMFVMSQNKVNKYKNGGYFIEF